MDDTLYERMAERHGFVLLLQFGSTVAGKTHGESDLDLAVLFGRVPSLENRLALQADLQALHPERIVDLVSLDTADPLLLKKVIERCRLLYGASRKLHELRILAFKRFQDHRRFLDMEREYLERSIRASLTR